MKIKCYYRRSMKMSADKQSAQVAHVVANLTRNKLPTEIVVRAVGDEEFNQLKNTPRCFVKEDAGTGLVLGFWEREE